MRLKPSVTPTPFKKVLFLVLVSLLFIGQASAGIISNATTSGFTSADISLNGSAWTGQNGGGLRLNLRNDSSLNMSGLVAAWYFDSESGTLARNVMNESGLVNITNQGTLVGMNTGLNNCTGKCSGWNSSGKYGNALVFDGVDDYISAGSNVTLTTAYSIEGWVKIPTNPGSAERTLMSLSATPGGFPRFSPHFYTANRPLIYLSGSNYRYGSTNLADNRWHHIAFIVNGTNATDILNAKIYVDGIEEVYGSYMSTSLPATPSGKAWIGTNSFNGSLDEVRIQNRALSADEIAVSYNTSFRTQAMPVIMNQVASLGNVINRTRIVYTGQDAENNASIYTKQNGTTSWTLIEANATNNTWYSITNRFNAMDFGVQLNSNGSKTPFFTSLEWDETLLISPIITSWSNNYSNNDSIAITIPKFTIVDFNVTSDIVSTNWNWNGATIFQGNGTTASNASHNFSAVGTYTVTVYGNNSIGNSSVITWTVTVQFCCYNLSGHITNTLALPLQNARIDFNSSYVFSDATGYYNLSGISEGTHTVLVRAIGYKNNTNTTLINSNLTMNFTIQEKVSGGGSIIATPGFTYGIVFISIVVIYCIRKRK